MAKVELKQPIVEEISELLNGAATAVVVDYRGLTVAQHLEGPTAIAVCKDDATAAARVLAKFAKTAEALEIKGGVVDGVYYDQAGIAQIASIPSREVLLSKLLGSMQSPITNFARVIKQIAEKDEEAA